MRRGTLLLASLLLAGPRALAADGRAAFAATVGGGYASDAFIGAGLGPDGVAQLTPSARVDLSFSPRLKFGTAADVSYGRYLSSAFTELSEDAGLELRWLPSAAVEASLGLSGEHTAYSAGAPLDPALFTSPTVSDTVAYQLAPLVRARAAGVEWRAAGVLGGRSSTLPAGASVPELDLALLGGALWPVDRALSFSATYKYQRTTSSRTDFALSAHAIFLGVTARILADDLLEGQLQLQTAGFESASREYLARATATLTHPLSELVDAVLTYSFAGNVSNDPLRPTASRHLAFLALRVRFGGFSW